MKQRMGWAGSPVCTNTTDKGEVQCWTGPSLPVRLKQMVCCSDPWLEAAERRRKCNFQGWRWNQHGSAKKSAVFLISLLRLASKSESIHLKPHIKKPIFCRNPHVHSLVQNTVLVSLAVVYLGEFKLTMSRENTYQVLNHCLLFTAASLNMNPKVRKKGCYVGTPCPLCFGSIRNKTHFTKFQSPHHFFTKYFTTEPFIFGTLGDLNAPNSFVLNQTCIFPHPLTRCTPGKQRNAIRNCLVLPLNFKKDSWATRQGITQHFSPYLSRLCKCMCVSSPLYLIVCTSVNYYMCACACFSSAIVESGSWGKKK